MRRALIWISSGWVPAYLIYEGFSSTPTLLKDLYLYNGLVAFFLLTLSLSPSFNDKTARATTLLAFASWGAGSLIQSTANFYSLSSQALWIAQILYCLFYPLMLIAIPRILQGKRSLDSLEIIDGAIFGLGIASMGSALILTQVLPTSLSNTTDTYFAILNPVGDLILIIATFISLSRRKIHRRSLALVAGVVVFAATDFIFLWRTLHGTYQFGGVSDEGWLIGLLLIGLAFHLPARDEGEIAGLSPILIALSVFASATLLALIALNPTLMPSFILVPTIATLFLAFIRMAIALKQARSLGEEKVLARTDELTGLANRRRLISEISHFESGALLLLDLDGFKPVNDKYGHEMGDRVLRLVASRFHRALPTGSILARLGGDEFGVLVHGDQLSTMECALALRATLSYPFAIDDQEIKIGVSIGHALASGEGDLLRRADLAMYEAKRSGVGVVTSSL